MTLDFLILIYGLAFLCLFKTCVISAVYFFFFLFCCFLFFFFFFQAEDGIRDADVTGVQTCALPIYGRNFNETFVPVFTSGYDPEDYYFAIFNRWGERIFETNEPNLGWDGRDLRTGQEVLTGTYIWKIEFKETMSTKRHIEHGHVNLLK